MYVKKEVKLPEVVEENVQTVFLKKEIIEMNWKINNGNNYQELSLFFHKFKF